MMTRGRGEAGTRRRITLEKGWSAGNRAALDEIVGREYRHSPIAVFDWDNTCIRGDIGVAVYHQLCRDLAFHFDAPGFLEWITEVTPADLVSQAIADYRSHPTPETRLRLRWSLEQQWTAFLDGPDDGAVWAWDTGTFIGWSVDEVHVYTRRVIAAELRVPLGSETLAADGARVEIPRGLRIRPALQELIQCMQHAGWQVWVISASPQWVVEAFAQLYGIPPARVVGMRRVVIDGKITAQVEPPVSFSDGKLDAYQAFVSRAQPPTFAAGDSVNDWKILEWAEFGRLLIEPAPEPLRAFALWRQSAGEPWLLQEFD